MVDVVTPAGPPTPPTVTVGRVVVLASGSGSTMAALLAAHRDAAWGGRVVGVITDRECGALDRARAEGIPTAVVTPAAFADRAQWDRGISEAIGVFAPALVVSAGFMRILGQAVLARWGGLILNTHPALLPSFPGAHAVRDALAHGVSITGSTLHVVDAGVDTGPILAQVAVPVHDDDTEQTLHERIKDAERSMLVEWVGRVLRDGLWIDGQRARVGRAEAEAATVASSLR